MYPDNRPETEEQPPHSPEFDALSMLLEAYLSMIGRDAALAYLHILASELEKADERPLPMHLGSGGVRSQRWARAWVRRHISLWLGRYG